MKILLIDNFHYRRGGAEVVYLNTGDMLRANGHKVVYFSQQWEQNIRSEYNCYFPKGIEVSSARGLRKIKCVFNYFYNLEAAQQLNKLLKKFHPDIAHIHLFWGGLSPSILNVLKQHHIPVVHTAHDYRMVCPSYAFKDGKGYICERCNAGNFLNCILRKCAKNNLPMSVLMTAEMYFRNTFFHPTKYISTFIFVSKFSRDKHIAHDKRFTMTKNEIMYNFSNSDVSSNAIAGIDTYSSYYLYYGRLSYEKGIETLILAFSQYRDKNLKIVGTGPLEQSLKEKCQNLNNIEFLGYKSGDDLYNIIRNAKYVCVTSECYENNPMTIIESYTLYTPVIGASIGGITEIVYNGSTGFAFESGNVTSLCAAINKSAKITQEEYFNMKYSAKKFAETHFNAHKYYESLIKLYSETINKMI